MPTKKKVSKKAAAKKTVQKKSAPEAAKALIGQITSGPGGRPTLYKPEFCDEIIKYFDVEPYTVQIVLNEKTGNESHRKVANDYPTLAGFAKHIKVSRSVLQFWMQAHPEFLLAVSRTPQGIDPSA